MRRTWPVLLALAACRSTLSDLPPGEPPPPDRALVAASMDFAGTRVDPELYVESLDGDDYTLLPDNPAFLVALPPGTYELRRFGDFVPTADRLLFEARAGSVGYIGSFSVARDAEGDVKIAVRDESDAVRETLAARYGASLPPFETRLVRSSLAPLDPEGAPLVVDVQRLRRQSYPHGYYDPFYRWHYPYWYWWRPWPVRRHP